MKVLQSFPLYETKNLPIRRVFKDHFWINVEDEEFEEECPVCGDDIEECECFDIG